MARAHRAAFVFILFSALYILALYAFIPVPHAAEEVLPLLPWWLLVSFGSYSLWSLGWGVFTFRDCPEAYQELMHEIGQAKDDLRARGVTVD
ncbi:dolichol-phosphate mannosyltransferase subunit 3, partial [Hygrophoropsis aurantiaca]